MKKQTNKKAFTMVELLAAIVILGILSGIGIASVTKVIEKSKVNYYKTEKNTFLEAGQSYVENNRELLPKNIGEVKTYTLQDLYDAKVLTEKLTDENGDTCRAKESKFYVYKSSSSNYKYSAVLVCPSCENSNNCNTITGEKTPAITISYSKCNGNYENPPTATVNLDGNSKKIVSYSYTISKNGTNVYSSEAIRTKEKTNMKFTINLTKYIPGPLKITVTVTNEDGITSIKSLNAPTEGDGTKAYCSDYLTVGCGDHNYETVNNTYTALDDNQTECSKDDWLNASKSEGRKVWVKCESYKGTDCKEPIYSGTYTMDSTTKSITISDAAGNKNSCKVATCIDKTYPTIKAEIYKKPSSGNVKSSDLIKSFDITGTKSLKESLNNVTDWINNDTAPNGVVIRVTASDATSGIDTFYYQTKDTKKNETDEKKLQYHDKQKISGTSKDITLTDSGYQQYRFETTDIAGNTSVLEIAVKLDNVLPTISTLTYKKEDNTKYESTWYNKNVTASASVSDAISGIANQTFYKDTAVSDTTTSNYWTGNSSFSYTYTDEGNYKSKFKVCDIAGNCTTSTDKTIKIDKTKPTCSVSSSCSNNGSGSWCKGKITLSATGSDTLSGVASKRVNKTEVNYDTTGETITETIKDNAGNTNTCTKTVYRDGTAPTCGTAHNESTTWTKENRTINQDCSDATSKCVQNTYSHTFSTSTTTYTQTISDNAGNTRNCAYNVYVDKCNSKKGWEYTTSCRCNGDQKKTRVRKSNYSTSTIVCETENVDCSSSCCNSISLSGHSNSDGSTCPNCGSSVNQDHKVWWNISGCTDGLSGYICYYNPAGTGLSCWYAQANYRNGWCGSPSPNAAGHVYFNSTTWYHIRSTEYSYAYAKNKNNHYDSSLVCTGTNC